MQFKQKSRTAKTALNPNFERGRPNIKAYLATPGQPCVHGKGGLVLLSQTDAFCLFTVYLLAFFFFLVFYKGFL